MDEQATEMLTKGLYTKKRKGKAQNDGSKRAKIGVSSSGVPASTATASKVIAGIETSLIAEVGPAGMGPVPSMPLGPFDGDQVLELPIKKGIGEERKRKPLRRRPARLA
ncbi:hypothetical protein COCNU_scaffold000388G000030 [Cocos nucifera]|nr:hypothetical protein [Cocos nucifera]